MAQEFQWSMVVDIDRCIGCQACVVACYSENNLPLNTEDLVNQRRAHTWIRIERYWEGEYPDAKARFMPILCQHCNNAPCEPVCPVFATYHNSEGLNVQIYNRCVGTRYCINNCPYHVRYFNFWERPLPQPMNSYLNPDVTVRSKGITEKCTFCVQRVRRSQRDAARDGRELQDGDVQPACAQACPTNTLIFGNIKDPNSKVSQLSQDRRHYKLLEHLGTDPSVTYLKKVDPHARES